MHLRTASRYLFLAAIAVSGVVLVAACGDDDDDATPTATTGAASTAASPATAATSAPTTAPTNAPTAAASGDTGAVVQVRDVGSLGQVLVTPAGLTLYTFKSDAPNSGKSTCSGGCAGTWPPLTTTAATVTAPTGVTGTFALISRDDGSKQVTFNGQPLYRYAADTALGDAKGEGLGGVWFAAKVTPSTTTSQSNGSSDPYAGY